MLRRRAWLIAALSAWSATAGAAIRRGQALVFPRDHGAHLDARTEWWYATGWLGGSEAAPRWGFQLTFFRSRTNVAEGVPGRFAAHQLLFGHAALSDLAAQRHRHAQRIARWSGDGPAALGWASTSDGDVHLERWSLRHADGAWQARLPADDFSLELVLQPTQPLLLQGDAGFSRKGPEESQASHYYSEPQLAVRGTLGIDGQRSELSSGRAWLDREWSDQYLAGGAEGWDWIGINLLDGSALMAFRIRQRDGSTLWAGGSFRPPGRAALDFGPDEVKFTPGRRWTSPSSQARYPVEWQIETRAGRWALRALMDGQELDSRGSTGAIYWEGLAELLDAGGRRVGLGYLEMTGYAARLRMQ